MSPRQIILSLLIFASVLLPNGARGQWDRVVVLTSETLSGGGAQMVIDDSLRLHLFYHFEQPGPVTTFRLKYQKFDNWGNPLIQPIEIHPDTGSYTDYSPSAFLDRTGVIHVLWVRSFRVTPPNPYIEQYLYGRLNLYGEFLNEPHDISIGWDRGGTWENSAMLQDCTGVIWVSLREQYMTLSEAGEVIQPPTWILGHSEAPWLITFDLAMGLSGDIWASGRLLELPLPSLAQIRIDLPNQPLEIISPNDSLHPCYGFGIGGFHIDAQGCFHHILYRDDTGLFYRYDPRDGSPPDTIVFDPSPYGDSQSHLDLISPDTLMFLYGQSSPQSGLMRVCFDLSGNMVVEPTLHQYNPYFGISIACRFLARDGGIWIPGGCVHNGIPQVAMIHIPGPDEPPNVIGNQPRSQGATAQTISLFPQPAHDILYLSVSQFHQPPEIVIYNLLGQEVLNVGMISQSQTDLPIHLPASLPTGQYFLSLRAGNTSIVKPFVRLR